MPEPPFPHIFLDRSARDYTYKSPRSGRNKLILPARNRQSHAQRVRSQLDQAWGAASTQNRERRAVSLPARNGVYLEFEGAPAADLNTKSLDLRGSDIRLLNVLTRQDHSGEKITRATVFVPSGQERQFLKRIQDYANRDTNSGVPKNQKFVESIESIRMAVLESFWQDPLSLIPEDTAPDWCEAWLRTEGHKEDVSPFYDLCRELGIETRDGVLHFPERAVVLIRADRSQLGEIVASGDRLAEFRRAKETAGYWLDLDNQTQAEWVEDLLSRLSVDQSTNTWVCVLDTGANNGHQLLRAVLAVGDCHTLDPSWGTDDAEGHGTAICGLAAFGEELDWLLQSGEELTLRHRLESVKLIPRIGHHHDKELYGLRTQQSVARAEIEAPERNRVVCTAVSSEDERDKGRPSSWSGAIDALASGMDDDKQRLIIVSAGTIHDSSEWTGYPESNLTNAVHDPGQSWNALTVGACTAKTLVRDTANYGNYAPIAQKDQLSPFSTTSTIWEDKWPNKPDIVVEGGNAGIDSSGFATEIEDLSLLTTNCDPQEAQFAHANATSAASAIAAHMAAQIQAQYPNAWPETVRALLVHSASWSDGLKNQFWDLSKTEKQNFRQLLRICGYGVPGLERAMESAANHLTLVAQESLQPFQRKEQGRAYETRDMHLHQLPWPEAALLELPPGTPVSIKVTLSYFVEPGPGEVGWKDKYLYRSHGLDFDINGPTESEDEFRARINKAARGEEHESGGKSVPWMIGGYGGRKRGSVHSDIWETTAIQAAECNLIGIYPTIGWWKERQHLERGESRTRYSLIVSVWTPMQDVDIYTPVSIAIRPAIEIATS